MITKTCSFCKVTKPLAEYCPDKRAIDGKQARCKCCQNAIRNNSYSQRPWERTLRSIKSRCRNLNNKSYKYYGGRGIKCLINATELKALWFRDKASDMKCPSIGRIDNSRDYCYDNCQYEELGANVAERNSRVSSMPVNQFNRLGNFIKRWDSITEAAQWLRRADTLIIGVCKGKYGHKTAGGFIWKYAT